MRDVLYLAWRYLVFHRLKTGILVTSIMLIVYLPTGLNAVIEQSAEHLTARAEQTPLLVGAKGSPLELALNSLYFSTDHPELIGYAEAISVMDSGLANAIPLYVRFRSRSHPIVGTSLDYFGFRDLNFASGRPMAVLGECVLGAAVAESLGVQPGDSVISSTDTVFDLAGVYPLKMKVAGVLERAFTPDDDAIFVDVKTAWVIEGLGHGHQDLARPEAAARVLSRSEEIIVANASVVQFNEITEENLDSFHFHGDLASYPLTAVLAVPRDDKSGVILRGRYTNDNARSQIVRPLLVIEELLDTVLTIQQFILAAVIIVGLATVATAALVFMLSLKLRRREIDTMHKIGGSRLRVASMLLAEVVIVIVLSSSLAAVLTLVTWRFGPGVIESFVLT
ncbi:MAG: ABC transporter permease [Proteobacteria bacterium]|nr:ABC transporter permease [Pseudomonadota bacterium]